MKLHPGLVFAGLLGLGLSTYSCANGDTVAGSTGSGGDNGSGSGGSSSGGSTGSGGSANKGGNTGSGGSSKGGNTGSGGSVVSSGGNTGSGGSSKGGNTGSGGSVVSSGGNTGSGGSSSTGSGGSGTTGCGSSFAVTSIGFVSMPAVGGGCWSGFASDGGDAGSTIMPGAFSACGTPCMLTMTGTLNASNSTNNYAGYSYLGFNIGQDSAGGTATAVTPQGSGVTVTYTNASSAPVVRVALNADATGTTSWCAIATGSPANIKYSAFTQQCYNTTPGPAYTKQPLVSVQLSVPGAAASGAVNVTLVSVVENP